MSLKNIIKRTAKEKNTFANINNDLALSSIADDCPIYILLSYTFSRKFAAAGLFLQGIFTKEEYAKISLLHRTFLENIPQSEYYAVQKQYEADSLEFLQQYDTTLTLELVKSLIVMGETIESSKTKNIHANRDYNSIINYVAVLSNEERKFVYKFKNPRKKYKILVAVIIFLALLCIGYVFTLSFIPSESETTFEIETERYKDLW